MNNRVYVWDRFIRIFHWSLVLLFITSYLTGDENTGVHVYSGYAIAILVIARIGWGVIGSKHARFNDFLFRPSQVVAYAKSVMAGRPHDHLGHNPLGGLMIVSLLLTLLLTTLSGMKLYAVEEGRGPFADAGQFTLVANALASSDEHGGHDDDDKGYDGDEAGEEWWEDIHETAVNLMLMLIALHILGVLVSSRLEGQSLIRAMLTGYKRQG